MSGPTTNRIPLSRRRFNPRVGVDVYFGMKDEALAVTNGRGVFEFKIGSEK